MKNLIFFDIILQDSSNAAMQNYIKANTMNKPELLAPAGDIDKLKTALHFGADAVYIGMKDFSLRANTKNFDDAQLCEAIAYTHSLGKKIYIAFNIYFTPEQTDDIIAALQRLSQLCPDGMIISDPGIILLARQHAPNVPIHISTQANTTNQYAADFYKAQGADRIVLARELSLEQIRQIHQHTDIELEAFVHGAMCISYSGRCLLSTYMTTAGLGRRTDDTKTEPRSANKGDCVQPCRWEYILKEKSRPDQNYEVSEDEHGTYFMSSRDICMIDHIADLIDAGVCSFKVEGRMKSLLYISAIIASYRAAIDHVCDGTPLERQAIDRELNVVSHRDFSTGFFYQSPMTDANITSTMQYKREMRLSGKVLGNSGDKMTVKVYNTISTDSDLEYVAPGLNIVKVGRIELFDRNGTPTDKIHHCDEATVRLYDTDGNVIIGQSMDILRMEADF